ncbi:hypothetical protein WJX75_001352 [Coccomyxa subellipsoidea]|uniref:Naphthoate synthase n=1 Tax=Coccomyxa subellipsoidea TaxID=248742 RepID=A0ABR2YBA8_9CHLO
MQKAKKAFGKAEDKILKRAAEAAQLLREDTPTSVASEADTGALQRAPASQGAGSALDVLSDADQMGDPQSRRVQTLAAHLIPAQRVDVALEKSGLPSVIASPSSSRQQASRSSSSYDRVHGTVSSQPATWRTIPVVHGEALQDVRYEKAEGEGIAKITINRPEKRNAFRPQTTEEMMRCFSDARDDPDVGVVILTGEGAQAFCSGGDQSVRGEGGYVGPDKIPRLNVLDLQVQIRRLPKPVIAMVAGYAVGGGQILQMMCDITIAADNAVFGQTGPKVGSFDAGYGSTQMVRLVGQKKAREIWFLARLYNAQQALEMGLINTVVPLERLEEETLVWCREILRNSPTALRVLKAALNAAEDGQAGIQELGGNATLLFYQTEEGNEGRRAYLEKRPPDFSKFPRFP